MKKLIKIIINRLTRPYKIIARKPLESFELNVYSQNGEDGILEEIMRRLDIYQGTIVDIGAWDGLWLSNTTLALKKNPKMKALYIESDPEKVKNLQKLAKKIPSIVSVCAFVEPTGENSLDNLVKKSMLDAVRILNIDVDGMDYQMWAAYSGSPEIVIVEINSSLPIDSMQIGNENQTTAFTPMLNLGHKKGYTLVHHHGNMIFVRNDLVAKVGMPKDESAIFRFKK
jgi:hypothetical protein